MSITVPEFLEIFPIHLHCKQPGKLWVFWSQNEGSQINSSLADLGSRMISKKIKSAFSNMVFHSEFLAQFWAPVTIGGRRLLSTSDQPFAASDLSERFAMYRLNSAKYHYNIDVNTLVDIEPDPMIINGGPTTAFLNRMPYIYDLTRSPLEPCASYGTSISIMIPIYCPCQNFCIGVVECTICERSPYDLSDLHVDMNKALKEVGLDVFDVQELIQYKTIDGLKPARAEIAKALEIVCGSHNLTLAQLWIAYKDESQVPFSTSLEDTQTNRLMALKMTGYLYIPSSQTYLGEFYSLCDTVPQESGEQLALKTLQDYKPRYISKLCPDNLMSLTSRDMLTNSASNDNESSAVAICLRSIDTGDFDYVFEFIWPKHSNYVIFLEAILLTLKRCLPSFKFASGAELDGELDVIDVQTVTESETNKFKIFQGKSLLQGEVIDKQFEKTMTEAADNLLVSLSTFKRKLRDFGISEGIPKLRKRIANGTRDILTETSEDDNGANDQEPSDNINKDIMTIKATYEGNMIKFHLPISQVTFGTIEKEIGKKLNLKLSGGTYNIKYRDEDEDWRILFSDEEMSDFINCWRKKDRNIVMLCVQKIKNRS